MTSTCPYGKHQHPTKEAARQHLTSLLANPPSKRRKKKHRASKGRNTPGHHGGGSHSTHKDKSNPHGRPTPTTGVDHSNLRNLRNPRNRFFSDKSHHFDIYRCSSAQCDSWHIGHKRA